jgi:hypothetical protein
VYGAPPRLTLAQILAWADAHWAATGRRPLITPGAIPGTPGETWSKVTTCLRDGGRGLPGGLTLKTLFAGRWPPAVGDDAQSDPSAPA